MEFFTHGNGKKLQQSDSYKYVVKFLNKSVLDVEDVLRLLYPLSELDGTMTGNLIFPHLKASWIGQVPGFVKSTNDVCFDHYGRHPTQDEVDKIYRPLLNHCGWRHGKICLFTTNYDPVTDVVMGIAEAKGIPSHDGFNRLGKWDSGSYSLEKGGLAVYRLHGSMSWVERNGEILNSRDYSRRNPGFGEHLIIYPGFKGDPEIDGHPAFQFAHSAFRTELGQADVILAIGFSFRDPHLNRIFKSSLQSNKQLKVIVWNPEWPKGPDVGLGELVQEFGDRIVHFPKHFGDDEAIVELKALLAT